MKKIVHGVVNDSNGAHLACNKNLGMASGIEYTRNQSVSRITCKRCLVVMDMSFRCKNHSCASKGEPQRRIGVTSVCDQVFTPESDSWDDLEVHETLHGFCLECGRKVSKKVIDRLVSLSEG